MRERGEEAWPWLRVRERMFVCDLFTISRYVPYCPETSLFRYTSTRDLTAQSGCLEEFSVAAGRPAGTGGVSVPYSQAACRLLFPPCSENSLLPELPRISVELRLPEPLSEPLSSCLL